MIVRHRTVAGAAYASLTAGYGAVEVSASTSAAPAERWSRGAAPRPPPAGRPARRPPRPPLTPLCDHPAHVPPPSRSPAAGAPLGVDDLEQQPRAPLVSRHNLLWGLGIFAAGVAWGMAVAFADSLPIDLGFIAFVLKVVVGFVFVIGLVLRLLFRGFQVDRVALIAVLALGGATIGLNVGPTIVPAATVTGTFTFAPSIPAGTATTAGALECEWANGHWKIGALRTITPIEGLPTPHQLTDRLPAQDDEPGRRQGLEPRGRGERGIRVAARRPAARRGGSQRDAGPLPAPGGDRVHRGRPERGPGALQLGVSRSPRLLSRTATRTPNAAMTRIAAATSAASRLPWNSE